MKIAKKGIVTSALILTTASIITRLMGFFYRVYMSKTIGAEGMGLYQLIMPLYSLCWSIACAGFTTTISKLTAQENAKREYGNMGRILKQSLVASCSIALCLSFAMYFFAEPISINLLKDDRVIFSLKILSFALPFMAAGSCIRGYFLGLQQTVSPAISQVIEQAMRMTAIYILGASFIERGLEYACGAAVIGIFLGELVSFLYIFISYKIFKTKNKLTKKPSLKSTAVFSAIMAMAIPLGLNKITGSLLSAFQNLLIPTQLQAFGMSRTEAISIYGQMNGMALPLIFFPSALLLALSTTLVPAVSEASAVKNYSRIEYTISRSMLFTSIIGIGAAAVFLTLPYELGMLIYNQDISEMLFLLGIMCPLWYMNITISGTLNGLGEQKFMFRNSLISSAINIFFIYKLVPVYGINGYIFGWFISLLLVVALEITRVKKRIRIKIPFANLFVKPVFSALAAGLTAKYISKHLFRIFGMGITGIGISLFLLGIIYLTAIILLDVIAIKDIKALFKGLPLRKHQQAREKGKTFMDTN